ncbi:LacI family DNA-binding transcriptional regulator [Streptomyces sp. 16-176A]|uniref:LacI family DNA-binding transcriptional regulator n=1 Tax=Streptomyces sp. 16-176A TaxID=2530458 RepID=UPI00345D388A
MWEVAERAGVSHQTVSRCLKNERRHGGPGTRRRRRPDHHPGAVGAGSAARLRGARRWRERRRGGEARRSPQPTGPAPVGR